MTSKDINPIDIVDRAQTPNIVQFTKQSVLWLVKNNVLKLSNFFFFDFQKYFSSSYSGCLMYQNDSQLSTVSLEFDEIPINIASLYPWFVVSTSV